jgi:hypothetical protein
MKRHSTPARRHALATLAALALPWTLFGCAGTAPPSPSESDLVAAGFKVLTAKTAQQQEHLRSLPPGTITAWQRNGVEYYVYPDAGNDRLYVGTPKEYAAYRRLRPGDYPSSGQQQVSDVGSYNKQDAAMQKYTNRDLADPYYFWPTFGDLGWQ